MAPYLPSVLTDRIHPAGELTYRDLVSVLPMLDETVVIEVTGVQLPAPVTCHVNAGFRASNGGNVGASLGSGAGSVWDCEIGNRVWSEALPPCAPGCCPHLQAPSCKPLWRMASVSGPSWRGAFPRCFLL